MTVSVEKQLDAPFGDETLNVFTDLTAPETMMIREGLAEDPLKNPSVPTNGADITLEL